MKQLKLVDFHEVSHNLSNQELTEICIQVYDELNRKKEKEIAAEFYPYSNIKLTINNRNDKLIIRMADTLSDAPKNVLISAANIIISRYLNKKCEQQSRMLYREYIYSEEIRTKVKSIRRVRSKKKTSKPRGKFFDLTECFNNINSKYFKNTLTMPTLAWSTRRAKTNLGHYDMDLDSLVISKRLDNNKTPRYVVEYVVYHELLHQRYPGEFKDGRWVVHTPEFKRCEKLFEEYTRATKWLKDF